jgi:hypothetical protein
MLKVLGLIVLIFSLGGCQTKSLRKISSIDEHDIDCSIIDKGCLLRRNSDTVIVFFRGWISPADMSRYRGERNRVHQSSWTDSARDHLIRGEMALAPLDLDSSIFTVGSSHLGLTQNDLDQILEAANAQRLIFASHSGGYNGLRATILPIPRDYWERVVGIWLLDNFYGAARMAQDLERNFGGEFLRDHCYGFLTDHNYANYRQYFSSFCPKVRTQGVTHTNGIPRCLASFERGEECLDP